MAKRGGLENGLFRPTEPRPDKQENENADLDTGNIRPLGVGLKGGEVEALEGIAAAADVSRNALMRFAIRWFILQYRAGEVDLSEYVNAPPPPKKTLDMP